MTASGDIREVMVTGATGFVGRSIVRELLARGYTPVCLVRSPRKLFRQHPEVDPERFIPVAGGLQDETAVRQAVERSQAVMHLVGIIIERRLRGQSFNGIHVKGTRIVVDAAQQSGIRRYIHMSALGARAEAVSEYHRTKWVAEEHVRRSGLPWTIFRPSIIHGPHGEFMRLMKNFVCHAIPPFIPYFGDGQAKVQPVSVKDVAYCFVEALRRPETVGQTYPLGGPKTYTWIELYNACRAFIPGAKRWKPLVSQPVAAAKVMAVLSAAPMAFAELIIPSLGLYRFDRGQVRMSQEDAVCDHTLAEQTFGIRMKSFEDELAAYADQIH